MMREQNLGTTDIVVSAIGQGCALFSEGYGVPDDEQSLDALATAVDSGMTLFDTADAYGMGHNEQLLGRFAKGRQDIVFATKVGLVRKPGAPPSISNSPDYIRSACEASLLRLGVERLDLYYLQRRDSSVPIDEVIGAMAALVQAGKVRALGLSEVSAQTLRAAHAAHPIAAVQSEYSLWSRDPEGGVLQVCREIGASFIAYCPLGRGFFGAGIASLDGLDRGDFRRIMPRFQAGVLEKNRALLAPLAEFSNQRGVTTAQIALAWLLNKHSHVIAIPGSRQPAHIRDNAAAADLSLSAAEIAELDAMFLPAAVSGARLPPPAMAGIES
jgi:aryl-alcohol dehydrogenase-like predicted oxidoreductase